MRHIQQRYYLGRLRTLVEEITVNRYGFYEWFKHKKLFFVLLLGLCEVNSYLVANTQALNSIILRIFFVNCHFDDFDVFADLELVVDKFDCF